MSLVRLETKASFALALSAVAGFLDIGLSCLLVARLGMLHSLAGGLAGAIGFTLLLLLVRAGARTLGVDADAADDGIDDLIGRLEDVKRAAEDAEAPEVPEPRFQRYFWNAVIAVIFGVFSLMLLLLGFIRTFLTVIVFASFVPDREPLAVVATLIASIGIQFAVDTLVFEPRAKARGIER